MHPPRDKDMYLFIGKNVAYHPPTTHSPRADVYIFFYNDEKIMFEMEMIP